MTLFEGLLDAAWTMFVLAAIVNFAQLRKQRVSEDEPVDE
jgi:hypothetical protein